jgi:hypothetical protein
LDTSTGEHEDGTDSDTFSSSESFSDDGGGDGSNAASDFILRRGGRRVSMRIMCGIEVVYAITHDGYDRSKECRVRSVFEE